MHTGVSLSELQGAFVFHRKFLGKRLGHQIYMVVFSEEYTAWVCAHLWFIAHCWVSLITGVGYGVKQWGGKWDGMVGVANSCNWNCCSRLC